ncbi:hypothetical protein B0H67DRAFT_654800 [Lasiosphaeris hirsuta]|uniref:C2H2-type domain-containing protein n=1 Tax=Lasiosphaeris hirsuta TaxID=260670 RepID=A0AA40EE07_9PEZI|nr:hypothetical protein B0H67DRAFT_654800 [Lasiosphaeris hirsuta]
MGFSDIDESSSGSTCQPTVDWDKNTEDIRSIASGELNETRPNRWHGPRETWRGFIEGERELWLSLEGARKRDLAVHLYNSFKLRGAYPDENNGEGWEPPKAWCAWPIRAHEVPDDGLMVVDEMEDKDLEAETLRGPPAAYPSSNLEDEISATVLRFAKEKFAKRGLGTPFGGQSAVMEPVETDVEDADARSEEDEEGEGGARRSQRKGKGAALPEYFPVVSANDEVSYAMMRLAVRRILEKLDNTLTILHNSRLNSLNRDDESDSGTASEDDTELRAPVLKKKKSRSRQRQGQQRREERSGSKSRRLRAGERMALYHPRDWRDVLSSAALAGFSAEVLDRAGQRCASLFGQEFSLLAIPKEPAGPGMAGVQATTYLPGQIDILSDEENDEYEEDESDGGGEDGMGTIVSPGQAKGATTAQVVRQRMFFCPEAGCKKAVKGTDRRSNMTRHLKQIHGLGADKVVVVEAGQANPGQAKGPVTAQVVRQRMFFCPEAGCKKAVEGTDKKSNITRHLKQVHGLSVDKAVIVNPEDSMDEMDDGIHRDGFLRPMKMRKGWRGLDSIETRKYRQRRRAEDLRSDSG